MKWYESAQLKYLHYRHKISPILFILSFIIDLSFVKKPDSKETIIFISIQFILTAILILLTARAANVDMSAGKGNKWSTSIKIFLDILLQFTFGAMASALFVLYFKGADYVASLPLLILLAVFLLGNEFAHKHTSRLEVRYASTIVLAYAFLLYLVPLYRNELGNDSLLISSLMAFLIAFVIFFLIKKVAPALFICTKKVLIISIVSLFVGLPLLIIYDVIPPLPLMLREGSVANSVSKVHESEYILKLQPVALYKRLGIPLLRPTYTVNKGGDLVFFTAVYAPSEIRTDIVHIWKWYDPSIRDYIERSRIDLKVSGGRERGYRTYSIISNVEDGLWRVTAELKTGQVLGHRDFKVEYGEPNLVEAVK